MKAAYLPYPIYSQNAYSQDEKQRLIKQKSRFITVKIKSELRIQMPRRVVDLIYMTCLYISMSYILLVSNAEFMVIMILENK